MAENGQTELLTPYRWQLNLVGRELHKFRHLRASFSPDRHINTSLNSAAERAVELLGCMRVIQTHHEINRPSHLPWQLARLGRCVLAVDESGESPGLTGHTPRPVANNVSGKSEGSCHKFVHLWFYSPFYKTTAIFWIPPLFLNPLYLYIYSSLCLCLPALFPLFLTCFFSCWEMTQLGGRG